jgi:hypothetical protein
MSLKEYTSEVARLIDLSCLDMSADEVGAEIEAAFKAGKHPGKCAWALAEFLCEERPDRFMVGPHE